MKKFFLFAVAVFYVVPAFCQQASSAAPDTLYAGQLKEVDVIARWKNDTERYRYNQMKYYVTTILPYLDAATKLFKEINAKLEEPDLGRRERKEFLNSKEDEMRTQFEDKLRALNVTQGVLLVKLIARQTDMNIYHSLLEFRNPLIAIKWQAWARLHGLNLDKKYHPEDERYLELIMYDLGYPLPEAYALNKE
jgi:hypothetical protein